MDYYNEIAKENIEISKNTKMLDVGCGTGVSSSFDCFVAGIDSSIDLLSLNNNCIRLLGAAESLPFKDNSFDYVISITAIHNFSNVRKSIGEIKRVGSKSFALSILRKSKKFSVIKDCIAKNFKINKMIEEEKDAIFFCSKP